MTQPEFRPLEDGEEVIDGRVDERLWRQVHPQFVDDGVISSQAFKTTPKDDGKLSVSREAITAEGAYNQYEFESAGTWAITVHEVQTAGTRAVDDSQRPGTPRAHSYVDFRHLTNSQVNRVAKVLRAWANERGCAYSPPSTRQTAG